MIIKSKEQIEMTSLSVEKKKELCTYLGRAQGRNKDYAIECDGDDAAALLNWWHSRQRSKRLTNFGISWNYTRQLLTATMN